MRIPPVLTIVGVDYKIEWNDGQIKTVGRDGQDIKIETVANIDYHDTIINISTELGEQATDLTFIHEVVHGILFGMGYMHGFNVEDDEVERFTEGFAQIFLQVLNQILEYNMLYEDYYQDMERLECENFDEEKTVLNIDIDKVVEL